MALGVAAGVFAKMATRRALVRRLSSATLAGGALQCGQRATENRRTAIIPSSFGAYSLRLLQLPPGAGRVGASQAFAFTFSKAT